MMLPIPRVSEARLAPPLGSGLALLWRTAAKAGLSPRLLSVVVRILGGLHHFRRLRIRFERLAVIRGSFLKVVFCIIC
jgi:hypothetical protein